MNSDEIRFYQNQRNYFRNLAHETGESSAWDFYRSVRNKLKQAIRRRTIFTRNALSSKKPNEIWQIIHRILKPSTNPIRVNPNILNEHFLSTSARVFESSNLSETTANFSSIFEEFSGGDNELTLTEVSYNDVLREIKNLHSDTSTGTDCIPTKFIKYVAEDLAGPLCHILNNCIKLSCFPTAWKLSRISRLFRNVTILYPWTIGGLYPFFL